MSTISIKPLSECVKAYGKKVKRDYDQNTTDKLLEFIVDIDLRMITESKETAETDKLRVVLWFINGALTRKGLAPTARVSLGLVPRQPKKLIQLVHKADAPYYDLQWLGHKHPELVPTKWRGIIDLASTTKKVSHTSDDILIEAPSPTDFADIAFNDAERMVSRSMSIARMCMQLRISPAIQSEMRWLRSATTAKLLKQLNEKELELRKRMKAQSIKQLKPEHIEQRLLIVRAWQLAGGGVNWQAAANTYTAMTTKAITRQAIKDMITRLGQQKIIRRKKNRKTTKIPVLDK